MPVSTTLAQASKHPSSNLASFGLALTFALANNCSPEAEPTTSRAALTGIGQNINVTYDPIAQTLRNSLIPTTSETSIDLVRNADSTTNVVIGVMSVNPVDLFDISWAVLKNGGSTILLRNANDPNDPSIRWPALPDMSCSPWCLFASYSHDPVVRATGLPG